MLRLNVALKEDNVHHERISMTLDSKCTQANPNAKAICRLMKGTCNGVLGQTKNLTTCRHCVVVGAPQLVNVLGPLYL